MGYYPAICPACGSTCLWFSVNQTWYDCSFCKSLAAMAKAIQLRSSARTQFWGRP